MISQNCLRLFKSNFKFFFQSCSLILLLIVTLVSSSESNLIVKLPNGNQLIGLEQTSLYSNKGFVEFRGIKYGQSERFKPPVKYEEKWKEPRKSWEFGPVCPQDDVMNEPLEEGDIEEVVQVIGQEDCLTLNIATPSINSKGKNYPVAVWIHGGSFLYESGSSYGASKFMEHEMVLVTFNFRIGVLGFLNTEDGSIQGNMGLKDQVLALQWVQENIQYFGGDPNSVTLLGVNSGAISIHLHMLSPSSEGLFHRAIIQSGSSLAPWAITRHPADVAKNMGHWLNCNENLTLTKCLMEVDFEQIIRKQSRLTEWYIDPLVPVGPSIEKNGDEPKFLADSPYSIISSGNFWAKDKVPIIIGVNSHEGLLHSVDIVHHKMLMKVLNMEWVRALPITLMFRDTAVTGLKTVSDSIYKFYFADPPTSSDDDFKDEFDDEEMIENDKSHKSKLIGHDHNKFVELTQMYSDRYFNVPLHLTAQLHGTYSSPIYLYWFDYLGEQSTTQMSGYNVTIFGVSHFDQIQYMFTTPYFKENTKQEDIDFGKRFVAGLARFIIQGEPPLDNWVSLTREMVEGSVPFIYNRIGSLSDSYQLIEKFTSSVDFWNSLSLLENQFEINADYIENLKKSATASEATVVDNENELKNKIEL